MKTVKYVNTKVCLRIDKGYRRVFRHTSIPLTIKYQFYFKKCIKYHREMLVCDLTKDISQFRWLFHLNHNH